MFGIHLGIPEMEELWNRLEKKHCALRRCFDSQWFSLMDYHRGAASDQYRRGFGNDCIRLWRIAYRKWDDLHCASSACRPEQLFLPFPGGRWRCAGQGGSDGVSLSMMEGSHEVQSHHF